MINVLSRTGDGEAAATAASFSFSSSFACIDANLALRATSFARDAADGGPGFWGGGVCPRLSSSLGCATAMETDEEVEFPGSGVSGGLVGVRDDTLPTRAGTVGLISTLTLVLLSAPSFGVNVAVAVTGGFGFGFGFGFVGLGGDIFSRSVAVFKSARNVLGR